MAKDNLPVYKITIDPEYSENGEDLGIEQIAFTSTPAIKVMGMAFNSQVKPMIFTDDLKYRIVAPALIPMEIYRKDDEDGKHTNARMHLYERYLPQIFDDNWFFEFNSNNALVKRKQD